MQWLLLILLLPYLILLLRVYRNLKRIKPYSYSVKSNIFVSVVVACRNEENNLPGLLKAISEQDYNQGNFELIIVDDNSSDATFDIAIEFKGIKLLKVLKNSGSGKKKAIRTGIAASSGSLILTTDADCKPGKRWIGTIAGFYNEVNPEMIICPLSLETGAGFFHIFQELEFLGLQGITAGMAIAGNPVMCNGANLAFDKKTYEKHSGELHDELISGDDIFLLQSIKKDKGKIVWLESENAHLTTRLSDTMSSFLLQRARWISKAGAYDDHYSTFLAIITFVTAMTQLSFMIAAFFSVTFMLLFFAAFILKSIPDFLILTDVTSRYDKRRLLKLFIPSQVIYPLYIISVVASFIFRRRRII